MMPALHDPTRAVPLADLFRGMAVAGGDPDTCSVIGIAEDSREIVPGDLFLALPGLGGDHTREHIEAALAAGARVALTDSSAGGAQMPNVFHCRDLRQHASAIAGRYCGEPSHALDVVGITGTNGKSTVAHLVATALGGLTQSRPVGLLGTLGNGLVGALQPSALTTPGAVAAQGWLAALRAAGACSVVMEVSSHALDQQRVHAVRFAVAAFTNLTRDHLDYHGSLSAYAEAKLSLFGLPAVAACCYNAADPLAPRIRERLATGVPAIGWALGTAAGATLVPQSLGLGRDGIRMHGAWEGARWEIASPLIGRFNAENLLTALACLLLLGYAPGPAAAALSAAAPVRGRLECLDPVAQVASPPTVAMPMVVVDYAHTPDALEQALTTLRPLCNGRLVCVFGCGGDRDPGKRSLMGAIAERLADRVIVTSDNPRSEAPERIMEDILAGFSDARQAHREADRARAIAHAIHAASAGDLVLIAGKGHEAYQEIAGRRLPFSDQACARAALEARPSC